MPDIIGSTYEVIQQIGSGGGGIVYLARHLRLNKQVVLKADKRKITTRPELLRREVDVLKDLSHPYIPQVYDFFVESETVYTAMDFVDGESLDKSLKRNERFPQAQVIKWARQLLGALDYLHRPIHGDPPRGYVHSDIKPANIMRRKNGDICLIDFNISLALGEKNVIGASAGYASPEHYGLDFSFSSNTSTQCGQTELMDTGTATLPMPSNQSFTKQRMIIPDIRSDIYSIGATLYHLLSGKRPPKSAMDVPPLSEPGVSGQVASIINRAMNPNPDLRYQTAAEMLWDFEHLHENDSRTKKLRTQRRAAVTVLTALFLVGGVSAFTGLRWMERDQQAARVEAEQAAVAEQEAKLALELIQASQRALESGDTASARENALAALDKKTQYDAMAQKALTDALGVYDLVDGFKADHAVVLPGDVIKQTLSSSGVYAAALTSGQVSLVDMVTGQVLVELPANISACSDLVFVGEETMVYAGVNGVCAYDLVQRQMLWSTEDHAITIAISGDRNTVAAARPDGEGAEMYNRSTGEHKGSISFEGLRQKSQNNPFADPMDDIFVLDETGRYLAVSFENGAVCIFDTKDPNGSIEVFPESSYASFEGGFYGKYFGFTAYDGANSKFFAIDIPAAAFVGSLPASGQLRMDVCEDGFCLAESNVLVRLDLDTGAQTELAYVQSGIQGFSHTKDCTLIQTADQKLMFFDSNAVLFDQHDNIACDFAELSGAYAVVSGRDSSSLRLLKLEKHTGQQIFSYDGSYSHDEARFSSDRNTVMLFSVNGFRLYNRDGTRLAEISFPDPKQIYDQQYRRDESGDRLEVTCYDGTRLIYAATDGSLLYQETGPKPDEVPHEVFETEKYLIDFTLHDTTVVHDRNSREVIRELDSENYLTYVTEVDDGIITEYVTSQGERYGLLLDEQWETIAYLPKLCDIFPDGTLVFDDMRGNLRQSRIYSTQELIALGNTKQEEIT